MNKNSVEECVIEAMDGSDIGLFPYLPYILQDLWEIGASPESIIELINKHAHDYSNLEILDLGCGKGAVSVKMAQKFNCHCFGIDAIEEFITEAESKAQEYGVEQYCSFEVGDIRNRINYLQDFDIIVLGSIGPVFGDYFSTLTILKKHLRRGGYIIIDDAFIDDESNYSHHLMVKKSTALKQISKAGMKLIDEVVISEDDITNSNITILENIIKRCFELIKREPEKKKLFMDYIKNQKEENEVLEQKVKCSTLIIGYDQ